MKNDDRFLTADVAIARTPAFAVQPPPRCFTEVGLPGSKACGELATVRRRSDRWFGDTFHCDLHAEENDHRIQGAFVLRRVRVTCDVYIAGTDERQGAAQLEAVGRLTSAIGEAGGVLDVKLVSSTIGRYSKLDEREAALVVSGIPE